MRRFTFPVIAVLALICASSGIWFGGLRNEVEIARRFERIPRLADTPFFRCADSFYWVSYAREMLDTGNLRARFTRMDNAPYGRPNYAWASLNAWYLIALAKVWSVVLGISVRTALLPAAMWSGPILYSLALVVILVIGWRGRSFPSAAAAALILGSAPRVYDDFAYAVPGHHGWHDLACFATLAILAGAIRRTDSRRWFAAAGFAGAVAIWIGATQQAFGLAAAGLGALAGMIASRFVANKASSVSTSPEMANLPPAECWRAFGVTGAVAAIILYLVEYAPGPFGMRLEVNHPIYALGFLLGGEFLCRAQRLLFSGGKWPQADLLIALMSALALLGITMAALFGPSEWHTMRQPFMQRLHNEIAEFQPITLTPGPAWLMTLGTPMFLVGAAFWRAVRRDRTMRDRIALLVCALPTAVAIVLSFVQLRWAGIAGASGAAVAWVLFSDLGVARDSLAKSQVDPEFEVCQPSMSFLHAACILLSLGLVTGWNLLQNRDDARQVRAQVIDRLATMEVASVLQANSKIPNPIAIFSGQKERQAWINYVTGVRSVGSLYWDSPNGIRDEAEFLATYDEEAAHRIARTRGLNYVVVAPNGGDVVAYHYMWQGNKVAPQIRQTLAYRLAAPIPSPPHWLRILPPSTPAIRSEDIRVYRVL